MRKRIASEFALGVVLLLAIIVGGIFWLKSNSQIRGSQQDANQVASVIPQKKTIQPVKTTEETKCSPHYYEGDEKITAWVDSSNDDSKDELVIRIKDEDIKKLPFDEKNLPKNLSVKLIDATKSLKKEIIESTQDKPVSINIKGFADICQQPPLVSMQQATVAFKKS